ncbi:MAG: ester cyclase [Ktedonobacteraceae bacterium]|nr:ester cyclase [Ktedonobacteraceae bacterium]
MSKERCQQLLLTHMQAENAHQMQETLATLTQDCLFEDMALRQIFQGHDGARTYYQTWWDAFSTTAHPERVYYTDQDFAVAEIRFQGTHTGSFLGIEPTGRKVDIPTAIFVTFRDGLMAGERMYWDATTLLRQLGVPSLPTTR